MATKKRKQLMCYRNNLVLVTNQRVSQIFHISTYEVECEIDKVIEKREATKPIEIFKKAIEKLLPYTFGNIRRKKCIYGEEISIHDQVFYRRYLNYILNNETIKKENKRREENNQKRKEIFEENYQINSYVKISHDKMMKRLRTHFPDKI